MAEQAQQHEAQLHLVFDTVNETLRIGTCEHCVISEHSRPARAWNAAGDRDLDFDRDELLSKLAALGIEASIIDEYICP